MMAEQNNTINSSGASPRQIHPTSLPSQIEDEPIPSAHTMERNMKELQDTIARYRPLLYRRAYRYVGNSYDADDAVQDALLSAFKHLHQFKGNARMTTWLTSIVINSALTILRRRPRQPHSSLDERVSQDYNVPVSDTLVDIRPSPEDHCSMSESRRHLLQGVERLSPPLRTALQLRDFDGLTTIEAAQVLGVPISTLKTRVTRARERLTRDAKLRLKRATLVASMPAPNSCREVPAQMQNGT
jgi:RNA polymerase sigma-70 factor (ECF subfamily)